MQILLCKKSIDREGTGALSTLLSELRDRQHSPIVKDCLDRCQRCDLGFVMATADGYPLAVKGTAQLLSEVDALADDDDD